MEKLLLSKNEARKKLGVGIETLNEWISERKIRVISAGKSDKIPLVELHRFIDRELELTDKRYKGSALTFEDFSLYY